MRLNSPLNSFKSFVLFYNLSTSVSLLLCASIALRVSIRPYYLAVPLHVMASSKSADASTVPVLKDLTIENITENVHRINSQCSDPRLKYVMERLVSHLHDFARETRLSFDEWMAGIQFLTQVGQICTDVRQVCSSSIIASRK